MKYIRTKDGVYSVYTDDLDMNNEIDIDIAGLRAQHCRGLNYRLKIEDIIKIADTIEELCDEFVVVGIPNRTIIIREIDYKEQGLTLKQYVSLLFAQYEHITIYGAIWTDKGLIYVAKMNDKGELELL